MRVSKIKKDNLPLLAGVGILAIIVLFALIQAQINSGRMHQVQIINSEGKAVIFNVEVADNETVMKKGLSGRASLPQESGMFFVLEDEAKLGFWMKDMNFPIDMVFFNKDLTVTEINENAIPCSAECPVYFTQAPAQYALEINEGLAKKYNIAKGNKAKFS